MASATLAQLRSASNMAHLPLAGSWPGGPDGTFWSTGIGSGTAAIVALCDPVDSLSRRIGQLPVRPALTRPAVGQYLTMFRSLAAAWTMRTRPALMLALDSLGHFGDSLGQPLTWEALAGRRADNGRAAVRVLDALLRRLAAPVAGFDALNTDFSSYLTQMAAASGDLDADTVLVTERLEADGVHAFLLSQHANSLQSKLDDATVRADAWWLLGPHAAALRQEISLHGAALEGVRRQLDYQRAEQAATRAEADYLQSLLPTLSPYLAVVDRMGAAIGAVLDGLSVLRGALAELQAVMAEHPGAAGEAELQLSAVLPHWRALGAAASSLRGGPAPLMRPDG